MPLRSIIIGDLRFFAIAESSYLLRWHLHKRDRLPL